MAENPAPSLYTTVCMRFATIFGFLLLCSSVAFGQTPDPNISEIPDVVDPEGIDTGDFDGDGDEDVAVISAAKISILENTIDTDGGFGPPQVLTNGLNQGVGIAVADFNQDGIPDLVATEQFGSPQFRLGDGTGGFGSAQLLSSGSFSRLTFPVITDLNDDGFPDVLFHASTGSDAQILWFENQFDTSTGFASPQAISPTFPPSGTTLNSELVVGDIDNDGLDDLVYCAGPQLISQVNQFPSQGQLGAQQVISDLGSGSFGSFESVEIADLSGDGLLDVIAASLGSPIETRYFENNGANPGTFVTPITVASQEAGQVIATDVNGDGNEDIVLIYSAPFGSETAVWVENNLAATSDFGPTTVISDQVLRAAKGAVADLNGDSREDLLLTDRGFRFDVKYFEQAGVGSAYAAAESIVNVPPVGFATEIKMADVDYDGDLDTFVINIRDEIVWFENRLNTQGNHGPAQILTDGARGTRDIALRDVVGDARPDVIGAGSDTSPFVIENTSATSATAFGTPVSLPSGTGSYQDVVVGDLNGDGVNDIVATSADRLLYLNDASNVGSFQTPQDIASTSLLRGNTLLEDVDGDSDLDVVSFDDLGSGSREIRVRINASSGGTLQLAPSVTLSSNSDVREVTAVADVNQDGRQDIIAKGNADIFLIPGDASATNGFGTLSSIFSKTGAFPALGVSDVNLDGTPDFVTTKGSSISWVANASSDGTLSLESPIELVDQTFVSGLAALTVARVDDDTFPDLLIGGSYGRTNVSDVFDFGSGVPRPLGGVSWLKNQEEVSLPVELTSFTAAPTNESVVLRWSTATEQGNDRFDIERSMDGAAYEVVGSVKGAGTTTQVQQYAWTDDALPFASGAAQYRLRQVDVDGDESLSEPVRVELSAQTTRLNAPFPNPARNAVTVQFEVSERRPVTVEIFNALGQRVAQPVRAEEMSGKREIRVSTQNLASGVYFIRLRAGDQSFTERMTVVK